MIPKIKNYFTIDNICKSEREEYDQGASAAESNNSEKDIF